MERQAADARAESLIRALRGRAGVFNLTGEYEKSTRDCRHALHFCQKYIQGCRFAAELMLDLGRALFWKNEYREAEKVITAAMHGIDRKKDRRLFAGCLSMLARIPNNRNAMKYYRYCLRVLRETKDMEGASNMYNDIGLVYWNNGKLDRALEYFKKALKIAEDIKNRVAAGVVAGNMGIVYFSLGNLNEALRYFNRNLEVSKEINHRMRVAIALGNIGEVYKEQDQFEQALQFHKRALTIAQQIGSRMEIAFSYLYLGAIHNEQGTVNEAKGMLGRAKKMFKQMKDKRDLASVYVELAALHANNNEYDNSVAWASKALALSREISAKEIEIIALRALGRYLYESIAQARSAGKSKRFRLKSTIACLGASIKIAQDLKMRLEYARSLCEQARVLTNAGENNRARRQWKKAERIFQKAGAWLWLKKMRAWQLTGR